MVYSNETKKIKNLIQEADAVILGVGSGMTASGGLSYTDPMLVKKWYPEYYGLGKRSIFDIMGNYWPNTIDENNAARFWGFWARHIWHIRYAPDVLPPYKDLHELMSSKDYFIVSTNVDGQLEKAGFPKEKIFAPQGDYALFQCSKHCCDEVYDNRDLVENMVRNMPTVFEIRQEDVPKCPHCNGFLIPNLRCDDKFMEAPHIRNMKAYERFIDAGMGKSLVFLELGVGFNTPGIIRLPFEKMAISLERAVLIRINLDDIRTVYNVGEKGILLKGDITKVLRELVQG